MRMFHFSKINSTTNCNSNHNGCIKYGPSFFHSPNKKSPRNQNILTQHMRTLNKNSLIKISHNLHISPQERVVAIAVPIFPIRIEQLPIVAQLIIVIGEGIPVAIVEAIRDRDSAAVRTAELRPGGGGARGGQFAMMLEFIGTGGVG